MTLVREMLCANIHCIVYTREKCHSMPCLHYHQKGVVLEHFRPLATSTININNSYSVLHSLFYEIRAIYNIYWILPLLRKFVDLKPSQAFLIFTRDPQERSLWAVFQSQQRRAVGR